MDSSSIELPGSKIASVSVDGETVRIRFEPAYIVKTMTGSVERTRWWQNGELVFEGAELEGDLPALPGECAGGDVGENIFTYRDMIPIPLESRGRTRCDLHFRDSNERLVVAGETVRLNMDEVPRYIEHIRNPR